MFCGMSKLRVGDSSGGSFLDKIFLNKILGVPIFLAIMYLMFVFSISIGGAFQDFFDQSTRTLFIEVPYKLGQVLFVPDWLIIIFADGIGRGINITATFIPVLFCLFLFLSFLEHSGYIERATFIMNRLMSFLGLPGKSFVPLIVGLGCNVPAVMSARTLDSRADRILTIIMTPFMSCSARLAIYAVFIAAFFPTNGQNIIFALYLIGILVAILTGIMLRSTFLPVNTKQVTIDLPQYRWPSLSMLCRQSWYRLRRFLTKTGSLIIPFCIIIGLMSAYKPGPGGEASIESIGKNITPIFAPMGITEDNWPATVGLLAGVLAKEVVVGTLAALYTENDLEYYQHGEVSIGAGLQDAVTSIPENLSQLSDILFKPASAKVSPNIDKNVLGIMAMRFHDTNAAIAYMLFVLLYFPCISVVATIARELNKKWAMFSVVWTTGLAYMVAVSYYQIVTFWQHPMISATWVVGSIGVLTMWIWGFKVLVKRREVIGKNKFRLIPTRVLLAG
jgi:ferrous iron transport protein B